MVGIVTQSVLMKGELRGLVECTEDGDGNVIADDAEDGDGNVTADDVEDGNDGENDDVALGRADNRLGVLIAFLPAAIFLEGGGAGRASVTKGSFSIMKISASRNMLNTLYGGRLALETKYSSFALQKNVIRYWQTNSETHHSQSTHIPVSCPDEIT